MNMRLFGIVAMAALLVVGVVGTGHASLYNGDLIRVVYGGGYEEATDLGSITSITGSTTTLTLGDGASSSIAGGAAVKLSDFSAYGITSWSQLTVGYFAIVGSSNAQLSANEVFVSSTSVSVTSVTNDYTHGYWPATSNVFAYWGGSNLTSVFAATGTNSYELVMDSARSGSMDGWLGGTAVGEQTAPANGNSAKMYLFEWAGSGLKYSNGRSAYYGLDVAQAGTLKGILTTEVVGNQLYTQYASSAVPLPPSVLLFLPGLLGLIGLRRKVR